MNHKYTPLTSQQGRVITTEQLEEIVGAIIGGKYSWACVLILRFANYNPLQYIPYRTYKRLIKDRQANNSLRDLPQTYSPNRQEFSTGKYH